MSNTTEFYVYLLRCSDGTYYTGHTDNIEARIAAHHRGEIPGYTAGRRPLQLVWLASFASRQEAFDRERQVKGWSRAKKEALIRNDWERLIELARSRPAFASAHPEATAGSGYPNATPASAHAEPPSSAHPEPVEGGADALTTSPTKPVVVRPAATPSASAGAHAEPPPSARPEPPPPARPEPPPAAHAEPPSSAHPEPVEGGADAPSPLDPAAIRAVALDGYGTLFAYDTTDFRRDVGVILAEQRIEVEDFDAFFETWTRSYVRAGVWGEHGPSRERPHDDQVLNGPLPDWHSLWEIWRRQFEFAFEAYEVAGDATAAADHLRHALAEADVYPDAHDTIEELAWRGYLLGLLSNADEDFLQSALSRGRLRFSVIQSSESLRAYKPHRAIFAALCARLGCAPAEVLYVGDSPIADVNGAQNAGLRTAWIRREEAPYPDALPPPDLAIDHLTGLLDALPGRP